MTSLNFPDVNVWLALFWDGHEHAQIARNWFERSPDDRYFFCRFTQMSVLRLLTTRQIMQADVKSMTAAWKIFDRAFCDERIEFLLEPDGVEAAFRRYSKSGLASPKAWAAAYLAGFAETAGLRLVTFDRAFLSLPIKTLVLDNRL